MSHPERHHRRSVRLQEVSYAEAGWYFVTICAAHRACLFGEVAGEEVHLSEAGRIVEEEWRRTAEVRPYVTLDAFVVMPNHVHGVIGIAAGMPDPEEYAVIHGRRGVRPHAPTTDGPPGTIRNSLGAIVGNFKAMVTKRVNEAQVTPGAPMWQRNYYEHIVRNERDLDRIRRYITENPARWSEDLYFAPDEHRPGFR